jgi:hypothetical protein
MMVCAYRTMVCDIRTMLYDGMRISYDLTQQQISEGDFYHVTFPPISEERSHHMIPFGEPSCTQ